MMGLLLCNIFLTEFERSTTTGPTNRLNNYRRYIDYLVCFTKVVSIKYVEIKKLH